MKTSRISFVVVPFVAVLVLTGMMFTAGAARAGAAGDFVKVAAERTFAQLGNKELSDEQREKRFRTLLTETFDLPTIARFTLGRYWRRATDQQKEEYVKLFEDFVVLAYSNRFRDLTGKKFKINTVSQLNERETLVASQIILPGKPPVRVGWRVRNSNDAYKITDVSVEGISMSVTQRDEFASVIRQSGGRVDGLLRALKKKTGKE